MIYLNNAATSYPKPQIVTDSAIKYLQQTPLQTERLGFKASSNNFIWQCREKLARLFGSPAPEQMILTSGATESLNLVIAGLDCQQGHIISTNVEHNSVLRPLHHKMQNEKITFTLVQADQDGQITPDQIAQACGPNTKAIIVNHCSNVTGNITDIAVIADIAHKHNAIFIVDASQSAGCVEINVIRDHIDILAFTGHKALYGLPGIGGLYISPSIELKQLKVGGTGIYSESLQQPTIMPLRYEAGTPNFIGIQTLSAGLDFIFEQTIEKIQQHKCQLVKQLFQGLSTIPNIKIYGLMNQKALLLSFNILGKDPGEIAYMLDSCFGIIVRAGLHCAPLIHKSLNTYPQGTIRISPSFFTTEQEIVQCIQAIQQIVCTSYK